ncbi:hypothetical protein CAPTEDRAFT_181612 [Capitella teleta]|uniref:EGF-like domain-containing protein n=1 Tax=Capitella teleta TaxID=283909 RepID=R7TAD0_CAPTE|nr:hypothetical protein CAPTEDRAFT_181612 [Capitella teleta]|eukprot:ELT90664.1 hypothetical protein CAPTEDRAFT_181612 [Capitella teleta]
MLLSCFGYISLLFCSAFRRLALPVTVLFPDLCEDNGSCQNGGTCQVAPTYWAGYRCSCPPGFIGLTCQINFCDEARMTCRNGGTCEPKPGGFNCACHEGYTGTRCEKDFDWCYNKPCLNGGSCKADGNTGYICVCAPGFQGINCKEQVDECASSPCLNNGICMDKVNGYDCLCGEDYSGINCENLIFTDSCESEPCQNGGECDNLAGGKFACQCTDGYHGDTCEEKAENCGGCGEVGGALAPACKKKGGSTERCSKMKVVRSYTGHSWWRRMVERTVIVWGECDTDNYYCCDNAILVELNEGVRCAVPGWSSWGPCSSRCGGCGTQTRFKWQLANYQTRGNRRVQWRICDTESRDCNTNPCEDCSLYGCSKCCGSRGYRYRRPHRRCVHC